MKILNFYIQLPPSDPEAEVTLCKFFIHNGFQVVDATRFDPLTKLQDLEEVEKVVKERERVTNEDDD